jgi:hypothetical protein
MACFVPKAPNFAVPPSFPGGFAPHILWRWIAFWGSLGADVFDVGHGSRRILVKPNDDVPAAPHGRSG